MKHVRKKMNNKEEENMKDFTNIPIPFEELPQAEDIPLKAIERKYLMVRLFSDIIIFALLASGIFALQYMDKKPPFTIKENLSYIMLGVGILAIVTIIIGLLGFKYKRFAVREKDIIFQTGLILRKKIHVPFNRVQHVEVNQGVIDRFLDLAKLKIFTAGGSKSDLSIPGLNNEDALKMKSFILQKTEEDESI